MGEEEAALSADDEARVARLRARLQALPSHAAEADVPDDLLQVLREVGPMDKTLHHLRISLLEDEILLLVAAVVCPPGCALRQATAFIVAVLLPRVRGLGQPASRALLSALTAVARGHPRAAVESLILPLLSPPDGSPPPGSAQVEVVSRIAKDSLPPPSLSALVATAVGAPDPAAAEGGVPASALSPGWIAVLHLVLGLKPAIDARVMARLVEALDATVRAPDAPASLKLSNLVLAVVSKYSKEAAPVLPALALVAERLPQTGLKKAIISSIARALPK